MCRHITRWYKAHRIRLLQSITVPMYHKISMKHVWLYPSNLKSFRWTIVATQLHRKGNVTAQLSAQSMGKIVQITNVCLSFYHRPWDGKRRFNRVIGSESQVYVDFIWRSFLELLSTMCHELYKTR